VLRRGAAADDVGGGGGGVRAAAGGDESAVACGMVGAVPGGDCRGLGVPRSTDAPIGCASRSGNCSRPFRAVVIASVFSVCFSIIASSLAALAALLSVCCGSVCCGSVYGGLNGSYLGCPGVGGCGVCVPPRSGAAGGAATMLSAGRRACRRVC